MGHKVTVDENGVVVLVEAVPDRESDATNSPSIKGQKRTGKANTRKTSTKNAKTKNAKTKTAENGKTRTGNFPLSGRAWTGPIIISKVPPSYRFRSRCPECSTKVGTERLAEHRRKVHGHGVARPAGGEVKVKRQARSPAGRPMLRCPSCTAMVREDRLESHRKKIHGSISGRGTSRAVPGNSQKKRNTPKSSPSRPRGASASSGGAPGNDTYRETLREMAEETRFGDKGLGQARRDHGRFGSIPLYDDYAEESDAD